MVKIYGAGGVRGLEAYQSGFLVSPEGHVLTAWSYVLDTDTVTAILHDGNRFEAELVGIDPTLEIAVLKIDARDLDYFDLSQAVSLAPGDLIYAFSNLYGIATGNEATSVLAGTVSARYRLAARRGTFKTLYQGPVYVLDAVTNNAGAAGGALTDRRGNLAGILGKELRSTESNVWLNYAIPISEVRQATFDIIQGVNTARPQDVATEEVGNPWTVAQLGLHLLPDLLFNTPPYVEEVVAGSPAAAADIQSDDLMMYVDGQLVRSQKDLFEELHKLSRDRPLTLVVLRGQELVTVTIEEAE